MTESKGKPDTIQLLFSDKQIARIEAVREARGYTRRTQVLYEIIANGLQVYEKTAEAAVDSNKG